MQPFFLPFFALRLAKLCPEILAEKWLENSNQRREILVFGTKRLQQMVLLCLKMFLKI